MQIGDRIDIVEGVGAAALRDEVNRRIAAIEAADDHVRDVRLGMATEGNAGEWWAALVALIVYRPGRGGRGA